MAEHRGHPVGSRAHLTTFSFHPVKVIPRAEAAAERFLTLPLFPAMADRDVEDVITAVRKVLGYYCR